MSVLKRVLQLCCVVPVSALVSTHVEAANTVTAASCDRTDVVAAINLAMPWDTVAVPAGTCTWGSEINLPANKDLTLLGAGIDQTVITCSSGFCVQGSNQVTSRISGFTFLEGGVEFKGPAVAGKTFRLDHNKFRSEVEWRKVEIWGGRPARHPTGLVDNNQFHNFAVHTFGTDESILDNPQQHELWAQNVPPGSGPGVVYIENNTFVGTKHQNAVDGNYAGRFVFRFNNLSGITYGEVHSVQGENRSVQLWEFYGNNYSKTGESWYPMAFVRGGTGVIFGNQVSADYTNYIVMDNVRSCHAFPVGGDPLVSADDVGKCDGTSPWDQNSGPSGYACRDQIGRGRDATVWAQPPASVPHAQLLMPAYFWGNVKEGASTPLPVLLGGDDCDGADLNFVHLVANRDWYNQEVSFTGATGVGMGTLAARPATCTAGVAYWATDQGEWNSTNSIPDGQLYKCGAGDTWSLHYKPYFYPHPLTSLVGVPSQPSNLRIIQ